MNEWLAQMYGTNGYEPQVQEEQAKLANLELFAKIAAKNNVDLSQLSDEQVNDLYFQTFPEEATKVAEEDKAPPFMKKEEKEKEDEDEEEKKESAAAYLQEKQAAEESFREKVAEADFMGRVMAHSFMQERSEIDKAAAAGTVRQAPGATQEKNAAAQFEELAAQQAIEIAKAAEYDPEVAHTRVSAVYTLGLGETEKIASVQNVDQALHIRGLEYLEAAGYPVKWDEIFGEQQ